MAAPSAASAGGFRCSGVGRAHLGLGVAAFGFYLVASAERGFRVVQEAAAHASAKTQVAATARVCQSPFQAGGCFQSWCSEKQEVKAVSFFKPGTSDC